MHTWQLEARTVLVVGVAIALLAGCNKPPSPPAPPAETPAPAAPTPVAPAAEATVPAIAQPETTAPAAARAEPAVAAMRLANSSSKMTVPVDLRYEFDGDVRTGQPVTLHLAAVPRVAGTNLQVSIKEEPGVVTTALKLGVQKATAATAYRQQLSMTKQEGGPAELRVLVTMDVPEGSTFGWFGVPFDRPVSAEKQAPATTRSLK